MTAHVRLFWSVSATAQFLEMEAALRKQLDSCVDLICKFPLIGTRLVTAGIKHHRRFVCGGFQIIYDLKETGFVDLNQKASKTKNSEATHRAEITIMWFKRV